MRVLNRLTKNEPLLAWILIAVLSLIWGSSFILIKRGLDAFTPEQVGVIRIGFSFLVLFPHAIKHSRKIPLKKFLIIFFSGLLGNLIPAVLFALAETRISSSLAGILNALTPMFTVLVSVLFFKSRIRLLQVFGVILAFAGCLSLSFVNNEGGLGEMNYFVWFVVIATLFYGINVNIIKHKLRDIGILTITSIALSTSGVIAIIYLLTTDFVHRLGNEPKALASLGFIAILGIIGTALAQFFMNKVIKISTPVFASSVTYLIPIVAVLWGILDGETLGFFHFAGMVITLAGVYIINKAKG